MREPKCPYFGECGGCSIQNIEYEQQLEKKKNFVLTELKKAGINIDAPLKIIYGAEFSYRNRMDFVFSVHGPGFRRKKRFDRIVPVRRCEISNDKINKILSEVWAWFERNKEKIDVFNLKTFSGTLKYAVIRACENTDSSTITFILNKDSDKLSEHIEMIKDFSKNTSAKNVIVGFVDKKVDMSISDECEIIKGNMNMTEKILSKEMSFFSQSFFQNNTKMTEKMVEYVRWIFEKERPKNAVLIDLYGGAGTFGLNMMELFDHTIVIDNEPNNINLLDKNIKSNKLTKKIQAICKDASFINNLWFDSHQTVYMITDPPRTGMDKKTIDRIRQLKPKKIIYVSCNPSQLAKDLNFLTREYVISSLAIFDLFPQTSHVETVVELDVM